MQSQRALLLSLLLLLLHVPGLNSGQGELLRHVRLTSALTDLFRGHFELQSEVDLLEKRLKRLEAQYSNQSGAMGPVAPAVLGSDTRPLPRPPDNPPLTPIPSSSVGGATYIRWGRTTCPQETELVYKGYVGGGHHHHDGSASNFLCLPEVPEYLTSAAPKFHAMVFGTEYKVTGEIFHGQPGLDHDVPCAMCRSPTRASVVMIPARISCYEGFHREYYGYLMAGLWKHKAGTEYICVDARPESVPGGALPSTEGATLYFTVGRCGSLYCPPYQDSRELTCVVCSK